MPKVLNQKGFLQLLPLLLIVGGLIAGLYLVQHPTIFRPKASSQNVTFSGACLTTQQATNTPVLTCNTVQLKFTSPLETGQTSDAGPNISLVKEAYAYEPYSYNATTGLFDFDKYTYACDKDNVVKHHYSNFGITLNPKDTTSIACASGGTCIPGTIGNVSCKEKTTPAPTGPADRKDGTTPAPFDPSKDRIDDTPLTPTPAAPDPDAICKSIVVGFPDLTGSDRSVTITSSPDSSVAEGQQISGLVKTFHCNNAGSASCDDQNADFDTILFSTYVTFIPPTTGSSSQVTLSSAVINSFLNKLPVACGRVQIDIGVACGVIGGKSYNLGRNCGAAAAPTTPTAVAPVTPTTDQPGTGGPSTPTCTKGQMPTNNAGYMTADQANCVLNWNKNIQPTYINGGWCSDESNKQGIANDWYAHLASDAEKAQVGTACLGAKAANVTPTRKTAKYRFAAGEVASDVLTTLTSPNNAWQIYTPGGTTVPYTFTTSLGTKYVYVQFMDNNNSIITVNGVDLFHDQIDLVNPIPANTGGTPATGDQTGNSSSAQCSSVTLGSENGNPGGIGSLVISATNSNQIAKEEIWISSNNEIGKNYSQVNSSFSWTKVAEFTSPTSHLSFTIPSGTAEGSHLVMVALYDSKGVLLDGNPNGILNSKCAGVLNIQSAGSQAPAPAANTGGGGTATVYDAKCTSVSAIGGSAAGQVAVLNVNYSGKTAYLETWMSEEVGINAGQVQNWRKITNSTATGDGPHTGSIAFNVPSDMQSGTHAIMVALRDNTLTMLDGNPGGTVNPACATTLAIK